MNAGITTAQSICSVFIADDNEETRESLRDALLRINPDCRIQTFESGEALLSFLNYLKPDLLFIDLDMHFQTSLSCIREIKANERIADIPIVVISTTSRESNIQAAYELGAHLYVLKSGLDHTHSATLKRVLTMEWQNPEAVRKTRYVNNKYLPFI